MATTDVWPLIDHTDEARLALAAGYDPADPAEFLGAMIRINDEQPFRQLAQYLAERSMTVGELWDIIIPAVDAERAAAPTVNGDGFPASPEARDAVTRLHGRGFAPDAIARLLELTEQQVSSYVEGRGLKVDERAVLALHADGKSLLEISRLLGVERTSLYPILRRHRAGAPHCTKPRVPFDTREAIIRLRNSGEKASDIQRLTGASGSQIKSVLRLANKKGTVLNYGVRT